MAYLAEEDSAGEGEADRFPSLYVARKASMPRAGASTRAIPPVRSMNEGKKGLDQ
jgi:hypothetical protein